MPRSARRAGRRGRQEACAPWWTTSTWRDAGAALSRQQFHRSAVARLVKEGIKAGIEAGIKAGIEAHAQADTQADAKADSRSRYRGRGHTS
ncbi:protein of unknown function [Paraburkholderia kururiensis]